MTQTQAVMLVVLAHPDDESFGAGGTLALYAQRGVAVHLVCATRGEAGEVLPEFLVGFDSVADRRVSELRCAAGILGLTGVYFLDYRDSGMAGSEDNALPQALVNAPVEDVAAKIVTYMRKLRPQVVITFDPIGGYKHPDHIAIHNATVLAFQQSGQAAFTDLEGRPPFQPGKLYYHTFPRRMLRWVVRLLPLLGRDPHHFGRNGDIDLADLVAQADFPIHASIDCRSVQAERQAAADCHSSQLEGGPPRSGLIGRVWRYFGGREQYMRAYPPVSDPKQRKETDLFN